jgi:K+ transporter
MFRVFSFNFIGISEPSPSSELVHVKAASVVPFASKADGSFFYSNWWFLVIVALSSVTLVVIIILVMCLRGKNKKFLLKRDKKLRNTMRMMKMNKMNQNGQQGTGVVDPSKAMQTNLRLETLLDNLTGKLFHSKQKLVKSY